MKRRPEVGSVVQFGLPNGRTAYGRVLNDACVAFYRATTPVPNEPPIGSRDFQFVVGVDEYTFRLDAVSLAGFDPAEDEADDWPPAFAVWNVMTGGARIYERGVLRPATPEEATGLEPVAAWSFEHLVPRLLQDSATAV